jgi:hypothetical protein
MTKLIRPIFYYCYDHNNSDQDRIIECMKLIPEKLRREVSDEYERLVKPNDGYSGRIAANKYLSGIARPYRVERKPRNPMVREIKLKPQVKQEIKPPVNRSPSSAARNDFICQKVRDREYKSKTGLWSKDV